MFYPRAFAWILVFSCTMQLSITIIWRAVRCIRTLRYQTLSVIERFASTNDFLLTICLKQERIAINRVSEKTPKSHDCKRERRLQKQQEQRITCMWLKKKKNVSEGCKREGFNLRWKIFREVSKYGPRAIPICRSCYVFSLTRWFSLLDHDIFKIDVMWAVTVNSLCRLTDKSARVYL